jgi:2-phosphosulfolactate phosphatase
MTGSTLEVTFTPADFSALEERDLSEVVCVVFDVLRATSSMITALANGALAVFPVSQISEALAIHNKNPDVLLAGERDGARIMSDLTGTIPFHLGNSPREFTRNAVQGRSIAMTTTNGTRALRACARAWSVLVCSFLNMSPTANLLRSELPRHLILVCSGTFEQVAFEDVLAAGALCELLWDHYADGDRADSAEMARNLFRQERADLQAAIGRSRNGRRLLANPDLSADVPFCLQQDKFNLVAELGPDGAVYKRR